MTNQENSGAQNAVENDYEVYSEAQENAIPENSEQNKEENLAEKAVDEQAKQPQQPKKLGGFQKKIQAQAQYIAELEKRLASQNDAGGKSEEVSKGEPKVDDFESVLDYVKAYTKWENEQSLKSFQENQLKTQEQQKIEAEYQRKSEEYEQRVEQNILSKVPDFYERAAQLYQQGLVTKEIENAVIDSPIGEMVTLYFMTHPEEMANLHGKSEAMVYREVAKIEAKLESGGMQGVKKTTTAGAPITPVKATAQTQKSLSDDIPYEDWVKLRRDSLRR